MTTRISSVLPSVLRVALRSLMALSAIVALSATAQTTAQTANTPTNNTSVSIQNAWARATVQGQKATGAFMQLTAKTDTTLVRVESPVAAVAEVHEMKMEGDVMKMRALENGLPLPAGKAVALQPGGYHVMLMDLKLPLQKDTTVPLTLVFKDAKGTLTQTQLKVPVAMAAPSGAAHEGHGMHGEKKKP